MKRFRFIIIIIIAFLFGFLHAWSLHTTIASTFVKGVASVPIWLIPLWLFLVFMFLIFIHEFGHLITFIVQGIKIRAFYVWFFVVYIDHETKRFKVRFRREQLLFVGGMVVPNIGPIESEKEYNSVRNKIARSLFAAPIFTIVSSASILLGTFLALMYSKNYLLIGLFVYASILTIIFSFIAIKSFFVSTAQIYGDFVAYRKIKEEEFFYLNSIIQYQMFSSYDDTKADWFFGKLEQTIIDNEIEYNSFYLSIVHEYFNYVNVFDFPSSQKAYERLKKMKPGRLFVSLEHRVLAYQLLQYYYRIGRGIGAYNLYLLFQEQLLKSEFEFRWLEHYMNIADHSDYLYHYKESLDRITLIFDILIDEEKLKQYYLKKADFLEVVCDYHARDLDREKTDKIRDRILEKYANKETKKLP